MKAVLILYPLAAMAGLTLVVSALMLRARIAEIKRNRIHPQKLGTRSQTAAVLSDTRAADNYLNLFEMPVLFYALCLALYLTLLVTPLMLAGAWLYVILRAAHSYIHIGPNKVLLRFQVFAASVVTLGLMWLAFVIQLAMRG